MAVKEGDMIKVEYTGSLEDGTVFDSSEKHGKPLEFQVGAGMLIKGFDKAVVGMEVGEEKESTFGPEEAYGQPNSQMIQKVPKDALPKGQEIKAGMILGVQAPTGQQFPATVKEVGETDITLDLNPPLAGKTLKFKIKIVEIGENKPIHDPKTCGHDHGDDSLEDAVGGSEEKPVAEEKPETPVEEPEEKPVEEPVAEEKSTETPVDEKPEVKDEPVTGDSKPEEKKPQG